MSIDERLKIISEIESTENKSRKAFSFYQSDILAGRMHEYVLRYLRDKLASSTVSEMTIISSINLCKLIIEAEATLYRDSVEREFYNLSDDQREEVESIYNELSVDDKYMIANQYFKLQNQTHIQWILKDGTVKPRPLMAHHLDVIPMSDDPEKAEAYIISSFDRDFVSKERVGQSQRPGLGEYPFTANLVNEKIADADDWRKSAKRHVVWSKEYNFTMNGKAEILSEETTNPLGIIPIVEIAKNKEFEYWIRQGQELSDFTIQFNAALSDAYHVVAMQGWGQAVFTGPDGLMPEVLKLGKNTVLRLPVDPNNPTAVDFKYVTSGADIEGTLSAVKMLLTMFLSSRGLDPKKIAITNEQGGQSFSSGLERLLSMIQEFESSKSDMSIFKMAEQESFEIIKKYIEVYSGTEFLPMFSSALPEDCYMTVKFKEPQMIQSDSEKLDLIQRKMEMGILSKARAYMEYYMVDEETAAVELAEIDAEGMNARSQSIPIQSQSDN